MKESTEKVLLSIGINGLVSDWNYTSKKVADDYIKNNLAELASLPNLSNKTLNRIFVLHREAFLKWLSIAKAEEDDNE